MKIISLNANGLSDFQKVKRILTKFHPLSPDIILLQEIFDYSITPDKLKFNIQTWTTIWKGDIHATPYVAVLISPHIQSSLSFESNDHRIMDISIFPPHSSQINIRNVYAPADNQAQRTFWNAFPDLPPIASIVG